jgi:O-antigen/teichoic acid export membrane protein
VSTTGEHNGDVLTSREAGGKLIRGGAIRLVGNGAGILAGLGAATLLLHHLGVSESGRYITVMSLVAIGGTIADAGLNVTGSRELALRPHDARPELVADFIGLRLLITPPALCLMVLFALLAGYPSRMVVGTVLAGTGLFIGTIADAILLLLVVELRNFGPALVDFLRQAITLSGVALLVALGSHLTPFFAIQIVVGLAVLTITPLLAGRSALVKPRFNLARQRALLTESLPAAAALVLGQLYFRFVIVLMSLISTSKQTGYFGGSLRAIEALIYVPILLAGAALPLLSAAARDDLARLRYAVEGLSEAAVLAGVLLILVTVRAAKPVMTLVGGPHFTPSGAVLRIQVVAVLFVALYQIWGATLIALGRQKELVLTNALAVAALAVFVMIFVPLFGATGGAIASVLGDAVLACLIYWRLRGAAGRVRLRIAFLGRVAVAAAAGCVALVVPGLPDIVAAAAAGVIFLSVGFAIGMVPNELRSAFAMRALARRVTH